MKSLLALLAVVLTSNAVAQNTLPAKFEPADGRVYHGVGQPPNGINEYHTMLGDSTIYPLVYKVYYDIPGSRGNKFAELRTMLLAQKAIGRFVELSLAMTNGTASTDSAIATSSMYNAVIDSIIQVCKDVNTRMFVRIGFEFNGPWNKYHPYLYVTAYRKIVDRFRTRGVADSCAFMWCYYPGGAPNDFDSTDSRGPRWYPGDSYVDWFGLDVFWVGDFHPDSASMTRASITSKGKSERFLAMATAKGKPTFLSETSAAGVNTTPDNQDGMKDWTAWFNPFFRFIQNHPTIKGYNYINWDWTKYPTWATWGDARIENSPYITQQYQAEMRKSKYIHLRSPQAPPPPADTPSVPITELNEFQWKGYDGGLYPNSMNTVPTDHLTGGMMMSRSVVPLDAAGMRDDVNGKIVLLSIGMSNCTNEFSVFKPMADKDTLKNPKVVVVDGAQGGQTASVIKDPNANFWTVVNQRLQTASVSPSQVQAIWLKEANANPTAAFPVHALDLKSHLKTIAGVLKQKYPNVKLCYLSSRTYGGYATTTLNPEPYAYEGGFSVKWVIEDQINGDSTLDYMGRAAKSPWLAWGPYLWANGTTPRKDNGLFYVREDFVTDGTHPSTTGRQKVADLLLSFFRTDATTKPWYLKSGGSVGVNDNEAVSESMVISPNPVARELRVALSSEASDGIEVSIANALGQVVAVGVVQYASVEVDVSTLPRGVYALRIGSAVRMFVKE